tara:strand:+ start:656 stop:1492 length:837 start_codon:yes stop_codon:yes gene_type:complete
MSDKYKTVIEASSPWKPFNFKEILRYRDMFYFKILNGYKAQQRQTVLSYFWVIFDPFISITAYTVIFNMIGKIDTGAVPFVAFNASVMAGWNFFNSSLNGSIHSIGSEAGLMQKVYFPRIYIPIIPTIINFPNFLIQLVCTYGILLYYGIFPSLQLLYLIPVIFCCIVLTTGIGLLLTTFFIQFKDLPIVWGYVMRFYFFSLPIVYTKTSISGLVPEKYMWIYDLNPGVPIIEGFRAAMIGTPMPWEKLGVAMLISCAVLYVGAVVFRLREPNIVDAM